MKLKELFSNYKKASIAVILAFVLVIAGVSIAIFGKTNSKDQHISSNLENNSETQGSVAKNEENNKDKENIDTEKTEESNGNKVDDNDKTNKDEGSDSKDTSDNTEGNNNKPETSDGKGKIPTQGNGQSTENKNEVVFTFYSSTAQNVYLSGEMNNWSTTATKMKKNGNWFTVSVPLEKNVQYKFIADNYWCIDPFSIDAKVD